ncbi:hypothetical protein NL676_009300 [Syzygium grande]|nr:hypothetical protein NL676_009300 [Syzygium grande]
MDHPQVADPVDTSERDGPPSFQLQNKDKVEDSLEKKAEVNEIVIGDGGVAFPIEGPEHFSESKAPSQDASPVGGAVLEVRMNLSLLLLYLKMFLQLISPSVQGKNEEKVQGPSEMSVERCGADDDGSGVNRW